jgi:hypothetical protein
VSNVCVDCVPFYISMPESWSLVLWKGQTYGIVDIMPLLGLALDKFTTYEILCFPASSICALPIGRDLFGFGKCERRKSTVDGRGREIPRRGPSEHTYTRRQHFSFMLLDDLQDTTDYMSSTTTQWMKSLKELWIQNRE